MRRILALAVFGLTSAAAGFATFRLNGPAHAQSTQARTVTTVPGMPPVIDAANLYSEVAAGRVSPALAHDLARIYVPNLRSNDVYVMMFT